MAARLCPIIIVLVLIFGSTTKARAIDITQLGGELTSSFTDRNAIQLTAPNVATEELSINQLTGFGVFHKVVNKPDGLGPRFNHASCSSCHVNNGRGKVRLKNNSHASTMVVKVSKKGGLNPDGSPIDVPKVGEQLLDHNLKGKNFFDISLIWKTVSGFYSDGTKYKLRKPRLRFTIKGKKHKKFAHSLRMTPPVIGPGLLEAIPEATILGFSDPDDLDGDGISGKPQYVLNKKNGAKELGRFGFKSSHPTLEQQSAAAFFNDIGITNSIFFKPDKPLELSDQDLFLLSIYQQLGGMPAAQNQGDPNVIRGKDLFSTIGCDSCHKFNIETSGHEYEALNGQTIHPFTDLLLHDLGPGLADLRSEFDASGAEWRTTPLWGLGFSKNLSKVKARFLHDGRARTVEEAILWHGGEGEASKSNFANLSLDDRQALLAFLDSL